MTRVLVIATAPCTSEAAKAVVASIGKTDRAIVVAPMVASAINYWLNDQRSRRDAATRLDAWLAALAAAGVEATGEVGDDDPLQALDDAVVVHRPDRIVLATPVAAEAGWLGHGLVGAARTRFPLPIEHVAVGAAGEVVDDAAASAPAERLHPARDPLLVALFGFLAALGSSFWFIGPAVGSLPNWALVVWGVFFDLGPKIVFVVLLWKLYLGRRFGDRIAAPYHPASR